MSETRKKREKNRGGQPSQRGIQAPDVGERTRGQAEGNARRARAAHGRKVNRISGARRRRCKGERRCKEIQGREGEGKEGKREARTVCRATAMSKKKEKRETTRP